MEVIGGVSAVITVIGSLTNLAKGLNEIREKYSNAALNITSVAVQLSTIRAALEAIVAWRNIARSASQVSRQLDEDLATSLKCCAILITVLDTRLNESGYTIGMKAKVRYLWLENVLLEYMSNLEGQVRALHLLLTVFQCRTATEQSQQLERRENRAVIERLRAETSSLQSNTKELHDAVSTLSLKPSVTLEVDSILLESLAYRKVYSHYMVHRPALQSLMTDDGPGAQPTRAKAGPTSYRGNIHQKAGRASSSDVDERVRDLEQQLKDSLSAHEDTKSILAGVEQAPSSELDQRLKDLEQQLKNSLSAHQDTKSILAGVEQQLTDSLSAHTVTKSLVKIREKRIEQEWNRIQNAQERVKSIVKAIQQADQTICDKFERLEADYQYAVRYVEVAEKLRRCMKDELTKYKCENRDMRIELDNIRVSRLEESTDDEAVIKE